MLDKDLREKLTCLFDRMSDEAIAAQPEIEKVTAEPLPEWMTASQLARYWQLVNAKGEPTTAAIMKWTKRSESEHPLPYCCMGDLLRFKRDSIERGHRFRPERVHEAANPVNLIFTSCFSGCDYCAFNR